MKFIHKTPTPSFFLEETEGLTQWNEYTHKRNLKKHILTYEQNGLCCYCESYVTLDNSHIEHLQPKSLNPETLTFDYTNLAVSCQGKCHTNGNQPATCGHKKGNDFDAERFLNPTTVENIRAYFEYTTHGEITASALDESKAHYTMSLLQLNASENALPQARLTALEQFRQSIRENAKKTKRDIKTVALSLLNKENLAFISFLRFTYHSLLASRP